MPQSNGSSGSDRLDRVESIIEALANRQQVEEEFARLLRAQVVTVDVVEKLGHTVEKLSRKVDALAEAQKHVDESLGALIVTVDEIIRGRKPS